MEAIILAGSFGKRIQGKINNIPKPMAPIDNKHFLDYIFYFLKKYGIENLILSVYYKMVVIKQHYKFNYNGIKYHILN